MLVNLLLPTLLAYVLSPALGLPQQQAVNNGGCRAQVPAFKDPTNGNQLDGPIGSPSGTRQLPDGANKRQKFLALPNKPQISGRSSNQILENEPS